MGSGLTSLAASILVYRLTGSALSVGLMLMATALPSLFVGLIASLYSIEWAFYLDALTFIVSALCIMLIRVAPLDVEDETNVATVVRNLCVGLGIVRDTPALAALDD